MNEDWQTNDKLCRSILMSKAIDRKELHRAVQWMKDKQPEEMDWSKFPSMQRLIRTDLSQLMLRVVSMFAKSLLILPNEVLEHVFTFLEDDDASWLNISLVCTDFRDICQNYRKQAFVMDGRTRIELYQGAPNHFYISLMHPEGNTSMYKIPSRGGWKHGDRDVLTTFYKVRFDPKTMMVHTGDFRFTKSVGICHHHVENPRHVPYAACFGCEGGQVDDGLASCDLRGTAFAFDMDKKDFKHDGCASYGTWKFSEGNKKLKLTGGGYCGWTTPVGAVSEMEAVMGGWYLKLKIDSEDFKQGMCKKQ